MPNSGISYKLGPNDEIIETITNHYTAVFNLNQDQANSRLITLFPE